MKTLFNFLILSFVVFSFGITSCSKKCEVEAKDTNNGEIIENVVIYPSSGSMTGNMGDDLVVDFNHKYADDFTLSFNNGERESVDYGQYKIMCNPVYVSCNAHFDRTVTFDHLNQKVIYKMIVTQCTDCWTKVYAENFVLVPNFPGNYTVEYDVTVIDKN